MRLALRIGVPSALLLAAVLFFCLPKGFALPVRVIPDAKRDQYALTLVMHAEEGTVSLRETIAFVNRTGDFLEKTVLRFYLNAFAGADTAPVAQDAWEAAYPDGFSPGNVQLMGVFRNGEALSCDFLDSECTSLSVPVGLQPGEACEISLNAVLTIPDMRGRCGRSADLWTLGNAIPMLALYDPETGGYRTDAYGPIGDPFLSECADFDVSVSVPDGWKPYGTAPFAEGKDGAFHAHAASVRDFLIVLARGMESKKAVFGDMTVEALVPANADVLPAAGNMLKCFSDFFGPCPYPYLFIVASDFPYGGMEYPGGVLLSKARFQDADGWELTLAHEIAHQWFYALVLSDQVNAAWQDEAMAEYAVILYVKTIYGDASGERIQYQKALLPMEKSGVSVTPGAPIDLFPDLETYLNLVYGHGCAYLCALDTYLDGGLPAFLRAYLDAYAYGFATRADFEEQLLFFSQTDLTALTADYLDTY
ncbi:MAG: hypothetical protein IJ174_00380 [Clostridia bacterium]|nr:hypothetical protein [Clostridia bacterium]